MEYKVKTIYIDGENIEEPSFNDMLSAQAWCKDIELCGVKHKEPSFNDIKEVMDFDDRYYTKHIIMCDGAEVEDRGWYRYIDRQEIL